MALLAALSLPLGFTDPSLAEAGSSVRQKALQLPPLPCGGVAAAVCGLGPSEPCYYDAACDDSSLLGCNAGGVGARCRFCGFGEYDSVPCPEAISTAHGDPLFQRNTTQKKFWMPLKEPVILMSWQALEPKETLELSGQAYETPTTHDQWFDSFALTSNGKQVFNVSSGFSHLGTVRLSLDGTAVGLTDERIVVRLFGQGCAISALHASSAAVAAALPATRHPPSSDAVAAHGGRLADSGRCPGSA